MPGFDGTGPMGMGPMTGAGRGYCSAPPERTALGMPGSRVFRRGGGRGRRNMYYATGMTSWQRAGYNSPVGTTPEEEKNILRKDAEVLKRELEGIQERLSELEKKV